MKGKNIKVYMQYPWKTSDSQYYKSIVDNPPEGVEYVSEEAKVGMITNKRTFKIRGFLKRHLGKFLIFTGISLINIKKTDSDKKYDLIHCAHCLSKNDFPWVADFEGPWQMWIMGRIGKRTHKKIRDILLSENCKKIIAWTETSKKDIEEMFPEIKNKIEIVTYAMPSQKFIRKERKDGKITLLYISRYFYNKGGLHALEAFDILTKKYKNVDAVFISDTPKEIYERYNRNKKIKILGLMPYEKILKEILPNADLFVYPGYSDSFGFTFAEALAFGLPVITVDGFARKDIIEDGKTGYVIERPESLSINKIGEVEKKVIKKIVDKTSLLIDNKNLRNRMSVTGMEMVKNGKFSIRERNKKLKKIYEEAVK